jgi:hypothetical protein
MQTITFKPVSYQDRQNMICILANMGLKTYVSEDHSLYNRTEYFVCVEVDDSLIVNHQLDMLKDTSKGI